MSLKTPAADFSEGSWVDKNIEMFCLKLEYLQHGLSFILDSDKLFNIFLHRMRMRGMITVSNTCVNVHMGLKNCEPIL